MPLMTDIEFAAIDWAAMPDDQFRDYNSGGHNGVTLNIRQRSKAQALRTGARVEGSKVPKVEYSPDWEPREIAGLSGMFSADGIFGVDLTRAPHKWGRMFWFAYFWKEASQGMGRADLMRLGYDAHENTPAANVAYIFNKLFVKPRSIVGLTHLDTKQPVDNFPATEFRAMLYILLDIGFKKLPLKVESGKISSAAFEWKQYCIMKEKIQLEIAWRSEDRTAAQIRERGGFEPQAHDQDWARYTNMSADWHPFSLESVRGYLWYRVGQNDNCKYTATSLAKDLRVSLGFPKLDNDNYPGLPNRDPGALSDLERRAVVKDGVPLIGHVKLSGAGKTEERWLIVTRVTVAQVILEKNIFDTQAAQDSFKPGSGFRELGVGKVPLRNIVGLFSFYRIHHGFAEPDGFTAVVDARHSEPTTAEHLLRFCASAEEAEQLSSILRPLYQGTLQTRPIASAWSATGYKEPGKKLTLSDGTTEASPREIKIGDSMVWNA